jgi:FKBP-type peptidyl-prolyl cis-trans isomerase FkpA
MTIRSAFRLILKNMKRDHIGLFFLLIIFSGCKDEFVKTDSGLEYKFVDRGNGKALTNGEYLILDLLIKSETDSVIYNSATAGMLFPVRYDTYKLKVGQKSALEEGLFMMREGDSAIFSVKASDVYTALNMPPPRTPDERIYCYARLVNIFDYEQYSSWKSDQLTRRRNENEAMIKESIAEDTHRIDSILAARRETFSVTGSGIRYTIIKQGTGPFPQPGDSVFFTYDVTYLDGTAPPDKFGKSGEKPKSFVMGSKRVFESWQESIGLLRKNGAGRFYIPSSLAFGTSEAYGIKPDAILVVNIRLVGLKKA